MANFNGITRTNYFRVKDEEKYKELFDGLYAEDEIHDFTYTDDNGVIYHGFGAMDWIGYDPTGEDEDHEYDFDDFISGIMDILPDDEAFIKFEIGWEKLRYVTGSVVVATKTNCQVMNLEDWGVDKARELLNNPHFETKYSY